MGVIDPSAWTSLTLRWDQVEPGMIVDSGTRSQDRSVPAEVRQIAPSGDRLAVFLELAIGANVEGDRQKVLGVDLEETVAVYVDVDDDGEVVGGLGMLLGRCPEVDWLSTPWSLVRPGAIVRLLGGDGIETCEVRAIRPDDDGSLLSVELACADGKRGDLSVRPTSAAVVQVRFDGPATEPPARPPANSVRGLQAMFRRRHFSRYL